MGKVHRLDKRKTAYRLTFAGMIFVMLFMLCLHVKAAPENTARVIRVGDMSPVLSDTSNEEHQEGYVCDYLEKISEITGWEYELVNTTWEESLKMLESGELDILPQMQYTPERAEKYLFPTYNMGMNCACLLVKHDRTDIYYNDYASFDGMKIGAITGTRQINLLEELAKEKGFTYELVEFEYNVDIADALENGKIDMALNESMQSTMNCKVVCCFRPDPIYFVVSKEHPELLEELDAALEQIQTLEINYHGNLYEKYYNADEYSSLAYTREEAEYIATHPVLKINYNRTWAPICYESEDTGECKGVVPDIMKLIEQETGFTFEYVPTINSEEIEGMLVDGELDLIFGSPIQFENRATKHGFMVTEPYMMVPMALAKRIDVDAGEINSIAISENNKIMMLFAERLFPESEIIFCKDVQSCLEAVYLRQADAAFENVYILSQYQSDERYMDIEILYTSQTEAEFGIGVRQGDTIVFSILNKAISRISEEDINDIFIYNTMAAPKLHADLLLGRYVVPGILIFGSLVILGLFISKRRVEKYAFEDSLTGYSNENRFLMNADRLKRVRNYVIVSIDIDHFKMINNMWNFETGNRILQQIAEILDQELQNNEFFCRKSDDHFLLCLKNEDGQEALTERIQGILAHVSALPKRENLEFLYTLSCGVCFLEDVDYDIHRAIGWASMARKKAKKEKLDSIVYYDSVLLEQAIKEQDIVNRMEDALNNGEFQVYYQPQVSITDDGVIGAEALARWIKADGKMIYPDEFIPVFEENGFITRLDLYIFEEVCKHIRKWLNQGKTICRVSVNVSQVHLRNEKFYLQYLDIMKKYDIPSQYIELELTESTIFKNKTQMISLMCSLKDAGIKIAMDDFGSGYSSLNLMKDLPIDYLKLDKEFFNTSLDSTRGKAVVKSIAEMACKLQIAVVAEGVETREQVEFLRGINCGIVQGYYYYKPMPLEEFEKLQG